MNVAGELQSSTKVTTSNELVSIDQFRKDWFQDRYFGLEEWLEASNTNLRLPLVSSWMWYLSADVTGLQH